MEKMLTDNRNNFLCPLCRSVLTKDRWIKITGQWEDQQKLLVDTQKQIKEAKRQKDELEKRFKQDLKKVSKESLESGFKKGAEKEKAERVKMSKLIENQTKSMKASNEKIAQLEKQLKEGRTPQTAGFDYEKEVIALLSEMFPGDTIEPTGKKGDAIQKIIIKDEVIGSILYECKKTSEYKNSFIEEVKRHQEVAKADYGVIVTHAKKDGKSSFFIQDDIIVIDPFCLLDVAVLLRSAVVDMHRLKLTKSELKEKGIAILRYMQGGEFKQNMVDAARKAEEAYQLMIQEINSHKRTWQDRYKLYFSIHTNVQSVRLEIGKIVTGNPQLGTEIHNFPELPEQVRK